MGKSYAALQAFFKRGESNFKRPPKINFEKFVLNMPRDGKWANYIFVNKPGGFGGGRFCYITPVG